MKFYIEKKGGIFYKRILLYKESAVYANKIVCSIFKDGCSDNTKRASMYYENGEKSFYLKNKFYFSIHKTNVYFNEDDFRFFCKEYKINKKQHSYALYKKIWHRFCKLQVFL